MGMYTELLLKCRIKDELPQVVKSTLGYMLYGGDTPNELPDHPLFECARWGYMLRFSSYYHHPEYVISKCDKYIFIRSDLKNYDDEICKFIDWIKPYLDNIEGECIGWSWHEEDDSPTLIHM